MRTADQKPFADLAKATLKEKGLRLTGPRLHVVDILANTAKPLSAYAIHQAIIDAGGRIDVVSVYRNLAVLLEARLVHHIHSADGYLPCAGVCQYENRTEHLVCNSCGVVTELQIPFSASQELADQLKQVGFTPSRLSIEVEGTCADCAKTP